MSEYVQIFATVDSRENAKRIAEKLLSDRLASCVQIIGPVSSAYWWKGRIEEATEWLCLAKSKAEDYEKIEAGIKSVHPYEVPEIVVTPISGGNVDYLRWIEEETAHHVERG